MENVTNAPVKKDISRKPYQKPQVIQVNLIAKEAVFVVGCKNVSLQSGPNSTCVPLGSCSTDGS